MLTMNAHNHLTKSSQKGKTKATNEKLIYGNMVIRLLDVDKMISYVSEQFLGHMRETFYSDDAKIKSTDCLLW